ncbi:MAG: gfo/Idh/MocA family oxidoreductase [bacterium]|nr:gfo/Idh/MocA family oxidoreductase [bacterium]
MTNETHDATRRTFLKTSSLSAAGLTVLSHKTFAQSEKNDAIQLGIIGIGGRGSSLLDTFLKKQGAKFVAVCDVYVKRRKRAAEKAGLNPDDPKVCFADYRELLKRDDIDAVIIATPDHWHSTIAIDALNAGKDVYLEKPMTKTVEQAKQVHETVQKTGRVLQVGSQTTSSDQWWKVKDVMQKGMIGKLIMSQGSYHRNSKEGEWNWDIDPNAGPKGTGDDYIDWDMWLGPAPKREWSADRFFRFRKFWDYSGGIATDLFYHVMAPFNICWPEPQFPYKVASSGGIYVFKDSREVPDTFAFMAEYPGEHQVVLSSSMANDTHIPGLIRGHEATIMIVEHGQFEGRTDHITVTAQRPFEKEFKAKWGDTVIKIPTEPREDHYDNFLRCVRTREKPNLDSGTAYRAMVTIAMSVESFRSGKILYFDEKNEKVLDTPPKA